MKYLVNDLMAEFAADNPYPDDFGKLWIPVVPLVKQKEIVNHITAIRQQAKALQQEGIEVLEQAKQKVESMIIG